MKKILLICMIITLVSLSAVFAQENTLLVATNAEFPPFEYFEGEEIVGLDIDFIKAIAEDMGLAIEVESMEFNAIVPSISSGKADLGIAGMTVSEERKISVDFSETYYNATQACIIKKGGKVSNLEDLKTALIGVQLGTTGDMVASDFEEDGAEVLRFSKGLDAILELAGGKIDAVVLDVPVAENILKALNNDELEIIDIEFEPEEYAIAVAKGNSELLEKINASIIKLKEDGTLDEIINKYFPSEETSDK